MNKKITLMQLFVVTLGLWNGYSFSMQRGAAGVGAHTVSRLPQASLSQQRYQDPAYQTLEPVYRPVSRQSVHPGGYNMPTPQAPQFKRAAQPQLGGQPQVSAQGQPTSRIQVTTPVAPWVFNQPITAKGSGGIFPNIDSLWDLYSTAPRTANYQFSNINQYNQMYEYAQIISNLGQTSKNSELAQACRALELLFEEQNPNLLSTQFFVIHLNNIISAANDIIKANQGLYSPLYQTNTHALVSEYRSLVAPGKAAPALFSAQQAVTGTLYDWTRPITSTIGEIASTGWEYAKWAGRGLGAGLGSVRQYVAPTKEEVKTAERELTKVQEEIGTLMLLKKQLGEQFMLDQQQQLDDLIKTESYYRSILRGWKYTLGTAAGLAAAGYLGYKYMQSGGK